MNRNTKSFRHWTLLASVNGSCISTARQKGRDSTFHRILTARYKTLWHGSLSKHLDQAFATDDGSFDQYLATCDKHGQPTRRLDGLYINEPSEMAIAPRMAECPQTSTAELIKMLVAQFMPFFRLIARILTFRDKKYRILTFRDKKYRVLTFRNKKYRILMLRHAKDVRPASLL